MTSMCTFDHIPLILQQHRATNDVQTHICTRCDIPVFLKSKKINAKGKCYTYSNSHWCNDKESSQTLMKECRPITKKLAKKMTLISYIFI